MKKQLVLATREKNSEVDVSELEENRVANEDPPPLFDGVLEKKIDHERDYESQEAIDERVVAHGEVVVLPGV
ncbi:hypothetical protein L596_018174 [Steinernema carpocapsae]|uniref:Uncharacterized protein n=1 Tax=Steinernema carpocapsae TaxID=34508 RepID=A0A4U5N4C3_STECR|nr:hypothetical protein L596_018174 [Steinernema carpocapsae]